MKKPKFRAEVGGMGSAMKQKVNRAKTEHGAGTKMPFAKFAEGGGVYGPATAEQRRKTQEVAPSAARRAWNRLASSDGAPRSEKVEQVLGTKLGRPKPAGGYAPRASEESSESFSKAFARHRAAGAKEFEWRGKKYNTKRADDLQPAAKEGEDFACGGTVKKYAKGGMVCRGWGAARGGKR